MNFRKMIYGIIALSICCSGTQALKLPDNNPQDKGNSSISEMGKELKESLNEGRTTIIKLAQIKVDSYTTGINLKKCESFLDFVKKIELLKKEIKNKHEKEIILPIFDKIEALLYPSFLAMFKTCFGEYNDVFLSNDIADLKKCLNTLELNKTTCSIRYKDSPDYELLNEYIIYISSKIHNLEETLLYSKKEFEELNTSASILNTFFSSIKKNHNIVLSNTQKALHEAYSKAFIMGFHLDTLKYILRSVISYNKILSKNIDEMNDYITKKQYLIKNHPSLLYAWSLCYNLEDDIFKEDGALIRLIKELKDDLNKINEFRALFDNCLDIDFIKNDLRTTYDKLEEAINIGIPIVENYVTDLGKLMNKIQSLSLSAKE